MRVTEGGLDFTWSDFGSSEQRKRHVKPNPDRLGPEIYQTHPRSVVKKSSYP
nr:heat-shock protein HtpX [Kroppenstedtia eburnea]